MIFVLDTNPLSLLANTNQKSDEAWKLSRWIIKAIENGYIIAIPEISYYECRRELVRAKRGESVQRLDEVCRVAEPRISYVPISKEIIIKATELWAWARQTGQKTAHDEALDADVILAATAILISLEYSLKTVVITQNVKHIERYTPAQNWTDISFS